MIPTRAISPTQIITPLERVKYQAGGTFQVLVIAKPTVLTGSNLNRKSLAIFNNSSKTVYIGFDQKVSPVTGFPIPPGGERKIEGFTDQVFGIVSDGIADCRIMEI
jgi:hypothetical protein